VLKGDQTLPTVLRVGRYRFFFFSNEGEEPPHVHVKAAEHEAKFWLLPVELATNYGFKGPDLRRIEELVEAHANELMEAWNEHFA
jgi:hypothetical protein